jgi:hypothetical protein
MKKKTIEEISEPVEECEGRKYRFHHNEMFRLIFQAATNLLQYHKDYY